VTRTPLKAIVKGRAGAFDLPSIIVAVIAVVVLTAGVLATVFGIIPFSQDNGAKQDIASVRTAEGAARAKDNRFMTDEELVAHGYLPESAVSAAAEPGEGAYGLSRVASEATRKVSVGVSADGSCYLATAKSGTGTIFYSTADHPEAEELTRDTETGCLDPEKTRVLTDALGGFAGEDAIAAPEVTGTLTNRTTADFSWNPVEGAEGYKVEKRVNGGPWTVVYETNGGITTDTTASISGSEGDTIEVRVTAVGGTAASAPQTFSVKLADPIVADGGFETPTAVSGSGGSSGSGGGSSPSPSPTSGTSGGGSSSGGSTWATDGPGAVVSTTSGHSGTSSMSLGDPTPSDSSVTQKVTLAQNMYSTLKFWYNATTAETVANADWFRVDVKNEAGSSLGNVWIRYNPATTGWTEVSVDLTRFKGQTVVLWFTVHNNGTRTTSVGVDDISVLTTPPVPTAAPSNIGVSGADQSATLTWAAPASPAAPISGYTITPYLGTAAQAPTEVAGDQTTATVSGLTNGPDYTFKITATNPGGTSPAGTSAAVTVNPRIITNGGFENGLASWTASTTAGNTGTKHSGINALVLGNNGTSDSYVSQTVNLPAGMHSTLNFWQYFSGGDYYNAPGDDWFELQVRSSTGGLLGTPIKYSNPDDSTGWSNPTVDLTQYQGQTVSLWFNVHNNGNYYSTAARIDDVSITATPPVVTSAPRNAGAAGSDGSANVVWAAPSAPAIPAVPITSYTVTPYLGTAAQTPVTVSGNPAPTSATITGLTNGADYTFTIAANNKAGTSPQSAPTLAVTPGPVTLENAGFEAELRGWDAGAAAQTTMTKRTGLRSAYLTYNTSGTSYIEQQVALPADQWPTLRFWYQTANYPAGSVAVKVYALDGTLLGTPFTAAGNSAPTWAEASADLTKWQGQIVRVRIEAGSTYTYVDDASLTSEAPHPTAAPDRVAASAKDQGASVTWAAPFSPSVPITSYTVTPYKDGVAQDPQEGNGTQAVFTGLTNGASYTFTVTATNSAGTSTESVPSVPVVPGTINLENPGFEGGLESWQNGGSATTTTTVHGGFGAALLGAVNVADSYVSQSIDVPSAMTSNLKFWYQGRTTETTTNKDWLKLQILNPAGTVLATPATIYNTTTAMSGWAQASVDLTQYKGQTVVLKFTAVNNATLATTFAVDDLTFTSAPPVPTAAPTNVTGDAFDGGATIVWTAPASPAVPITGYTITPYLGTAAQTPVQVDGTTTTATLTGLTNGQTYTFKVTSTNAAGISPAGTSHAFPVRENLLTNNGFELGNANWATTGNAATPGGVARTGLRAAYAGSYKGSNTLAQDITLPADRYATFSFAYKVYGSAYGSCGNYIEVTVKPVGGSTGSAYKNCEPYVDSGGNSNYTTAVVDLTAYRGQSVTLRLNMYNTDCCYQKSASFDDLSVITSPPIVPPAPTRVGASGNDGSATVTWLAPAAPVVPITGYTVTPYLGAVAQTPVTITGNPADTSAQITGLTNGANYTFKVAATNSAGTGPQSAASAAVTPGPVLLANGGFEAGLAEWVSATNVQTSTSTRTGFGTVLLGTSTVGDSYISQEVTLPSDKWPTLSFWYKTPAASANDWTEIQVRSTAGALLATPYKVTTTAASWTQANVDLTAFMGQTVSLWINVHNDGTSSARSTYLDDMTLTLADPAPTAAPTRVAASGSDGSASVTWAAPASPSVPITSYAVTPFKDGTAQATVQVTGDPADNNVTIDGLTNGSSYTFTVTATNSAGTSASSTPSTAVIPGPVSIKNAGFEAGLQGWASTSAQPSATAHSGFGSALLGTSAAGDSSISQVIDVPADMSSTVKFWFNGASAETTANADWVEMQVRSTTGTVLMAPWKYYNFTNPWGSATINLTTVKGQTVVLWFNVHNNGSLNSSMYLDDVALTSTPPVAPAAPTNLVLGNPGDGTTGTPLSWTAPSSPAVPITTYTVTPYLGTVAQTPVTVTGNPAPATTVLTGLTSGSTYTFTVTATNSAGTSPASAASVPVTAGPVILANGGFEDGLTSWTTSGPSASTTTKYAGAKAAVLGGTYSAIGSITQKVTVPSSGTTTLTFWYRQTNGESCTNCYDFGRYEIRDYSGISTLRSIYSNNVGTGWTKLTTDLSAYRGQTITLYFSQSNDGSGMSYSYIDDVAVSTVG
jgi:hypothetical protein